MRFYDVIDEQGRFKELKVDNQSPCGIVYKSHSVSYVFARALLEKEGEIMGLEKALNDDL